MCLAILLTDKAALPLQLPRLTTLPRPPLRQAEVSKQGGLP